MGVAESAKDSLPCRGDSLRSGQAAVWLSAAVGIVVAPALSAGDWTTTKGITFSQIYTDNVFLLPPGEEEDDFVTEVAPFITVTGRGGRGIGRF